MSGRPNSATLCPMISEKQFQAQVVELAGYCGWLVYHPHDSRRSAPGFPDLVLARPPRLVLVELKTDKGQIRPEQRVWLEALSGCVEAPETYIWRPADFENIQATLTPGGASRGGGGPHG